MKQGLLEEQVRQPSRLDQTKSFLHHHIRLLFFSGLALALLILFLTESEGLFVFLALVLLTLLVVHIISTYRHPGFSNWASMITVFVVYLCSFSVLAVIPVDITETMYYSDQGISKENMAQFHQHRDRFKSAYQGIYITSTLMTALVTNVLLIANLNGYLTWPKILKHALVTFAKKMALLAIVGTIVLILVLAMLDIPGNVVMVTLLVISNTFGIGWLVFLLGRGLVLFPLSFLTKHETESNIDLLLQSSADLFKKYRGLQMELKVAIQDFVKLIGKIKKDSPQYEYVEYLKGELPKYENVLGTAGHDLQAQVKNKASFGDSAQIDEEVIAQARANLKKNHEDLTRAVNLWHQNVDEIKANALLSSLDQPSDNSAFLRKDRRIVPMVVPRSHSMGNICTGLVLLFLSFLIVIHELMLAFGGGDSVLLFSKIKDGLGGHSSCIVLMILFIMAVQGYIIMVTNYSVSRQENVKMALGNTSNNALLMNSKMTFSLAFPLAYNTLMLFDETKEKENHPNFLAGFADFYDPITKIPLIGPYYNYIVPILIIVVIVIQITLKVKERLARRKPLSAELLRSLVEGERMVVQEIKRQERQAKAKALQEQTAKSLPVSEVNVELQMQQSVVEQPQVEEQSQEVTGAKENISGMLTDQTTNVRPQHRHFKVYNDTLLSYEHPSSDAVLSSLPLSGIYDVAEKGEQIVIEESNGKTLVLGASSAEEAQQWVSWLQYRLTQLQLEDL